MPRFSQGVKRGLSFRVKRDGIPKLQKKSDSSRRSRSILKIIFFRISGSIPSPFLDV